MIIMNNVHSLRTLHEMTSRVLPFHSSWFWNITAAALPISTVAHKPHLTSVRNLIEPFLSGFQFAGSSRFSES